MICRNLNTEYSFMKIFMSVWVYTVTKNEKSPFTI